MMKESQPFQMLKMALSFCILKIAVASPIIYRLQKSPHGVDVDPTGEYIVAGGKLAAVIPVHSFKNMKAAIEKGEFETEAPGDIPVVKYDKSIHCELAVVNTKDTSKSLCFGPLHTEFDGKKCLYFMFLSNNILKWRLGEKCEAVQKFQPTTTSVT